jgi:hypothetical protein
MRALSACLRAALGSGIGLRPTRTFYEVSELFVLGFCLNWVDLCVNEPSWDKLEKIKDSLSRKHDKGHEYFRVFVISYNF